MSEDLTCPKCNEPLEIDQAWKLIKPEKKGTTVKAGETIQGDYAHERCVWHE